MELIKVTEKTYYLECPSKIGIYKLSEDTVCLIDSGNDKDAGRKALRILEENNWQLKAIINTHSNADHIGGNRYLQDKTGCKIYAKGTEKVFTETTSLEPAFIYGACPPPELKTKFFIADPSVVTDINDPSFPSELEVISLEGHTLDQIGIKTPDNVLFVGDALFGPAIIEKYHINFLYDVKAQLETLDRIENTRASLYVPSHGPAVENVTDLVNCNRNKILEIADTILEICQEPLTFDKILQQIFNKYQLTMNIVQYSLVGSTIKSYLTYLYNEGKLEFSFINNEFLCKVK